RTFTPQQWHQTAGMMDKWRLVNNAELYDLSNDFAQKKNVIDQFLLLPPLSSPGTNSLPC
ncbi:MAG: hypothetical protein R3182_08075, partial [Draconibacterium sp.]|nr:hypothetical protein [Draconibacterium sp.]